MPPPLSHGLNTGSTSFAEILRGLTETQLAALLNERRLSIIHLLSSNLELYPYAAGVLHTTTTATATASSPLQWAAFADPPFSAGLPFPPSLYVTLRSAAGAVEAEDNDGGRDQEQARRQVWGPGTHEPDVELAAVIRENCAVIRRKAAQLHDVRREVERRGLSWRDGFAASALAAALRPIKTSAGSYLGGSAVAGVAPSSCRSQAEEAVKRATGIVDFVGVHGRVSAGVGGGGNDEENAIIAGSATCDDGPDVVRAMTPAVLALFDRLDDDLKVAAAGGSAGHSGNDNDDDGGGGGGANGANEDSDGIAAAVQRLADGWLRRLLDIEQARRDGGATTALENDASSRDQRAAETNGGGGQDVGHEQPPQGRYMVGRAEMPGLEVTSVAEMLAARGSRTGEWTARDGGSLSDGDLRARLAAMGLLDSSVQSTSANTVETDGHGNGHSRGVHGVNGANGVSAGDGGLYL